jgi:hypothetical protein
MSHHVFLNCFSSAVRRGESQRFDKVFSLSDDSGLLSFGSRCEEEVPERIGEAVEGEDRVTDSRLN